MYLKSLKITNFRKFGNENNLVEFVSSNNLAQNSDDVNVAQATTLIIGKNNAGKTTVTQALNKILRKGNEGTSLQANDFNFYYLNTLIEKYLDDTFDDFPSIEFEFTIEFDFDSQDCLVNNFFPFIKIGDIQNQEKNNNIKIILKYELSETVVFKNAFKAIINEQKKNDNNGNLKAVLFRRLLNLIDDKDTVFKFNYYDSDGKLSEETDFKITDLLEIETINANKTINDKSLSNTFNSIINFYYNLEKQNNGSDDIDLEIDKINKRMTTKVSESHNIKINEALEKIESHEKLEVKLSSDLTFQKLMKNIIKYEYKEGDFYIPEGQFGLGYANLMTIIGKLFEYLERYPEQDCHSKINLVCIEEPEAFMHIQMQELFIKHINDAFSYLLESNNKKINSQLIIITHSSHILNSKIHSGNSFNNICYITIVDNYSNVVNLNDNNVIGYPLDLEASKRNKTGKAGSQTEIEKKEQADLKFLKKHIKYKVSELFFSDAVIFVEGVTEETLLSYYIDQDERLNKYYISIFNINGAHGRVYHPLLKILKVPALIITDIDIKREPEEKDDFAQVTDIKSKCTTNQTIIRYNQGSEKLKDIDDYFLDDNIYIIFQREPIEGFFATSFEEAYILGNYKNDILNEVILEIKKKTYKEIVGEPKDLEKLKESSYELQRKLSKSKSDFSNSLLYKMVNSEDTDSKPELPEYIKDGLDWLSQKLSKKPNDEVAEK